MAKSCNVNQEACIGCGMCLSLADAVFAFNNDGKAESIVSEIDGELLAAAEEAAANCPTQAIELE